MLCPCPRDYTWSKAMALNYNGTWGDWSGSRDYERHALCAPMRSDRSLTFYNSTIWQLPFFSAVQRASRGRTWVAGRRRVSSH